MPEWHPNPKPSQPITERLETFEYLHGALGCFHAAVFQPCFRIDFHVFPLTAVQ